MGGLIGCWPSLGLGAARTQPTRLAGVCDELEASIPIVNIANRSAALFLPYLESGSVQGRIALVVVVSGRQRVADYALSRTAAADPI